MTRRLRLLSFALLIVAVSACGRYLTTGVAVVNGEMITREALDRQVASVYGNPQVQGAINPDDADQRLQIERQVIVQLIQDELIRQEGKRLKVNVTSAQVNERFQAIAAAQPDEIQREVQARGEAAVRELIKGQIIAEKLAELAGGAAPPTDAEIRAAYGNGQRFEEIRVRHILFLVQAGADEAAAQKKAQDALKKLQSGSDFATLAKQVSEDPGSKDAGGDLGYITREVNFDETFLNAAFAVKEGKFSGLVRTQFGFHIKVDDRRTKTLEEARAELTEEIATQKRTQSFQTYIVERLRAADIVVNPRWGDFDPETFEIQKHDFFVPPSPEPETQPIPFQ